MPEWEQPSIDPAGNWQTAWRNEGTRYKQYNRWLFGVIEYDPSGPEHDFGGDYLWLLYIDDGPNIDIGRSETFADAEAAADYNANTDYTKRKVAEWAGPGRSLREHLAQERRESALTRLAHVKPYFRVGP